MQEIKKFHEIRLSDQKKFDDIVYKTLKKKLFNDENKNKLLRKNLSILKKTPKEFNIMHPLRVAFYSTIFFEKNIELISLCIFHNLFEIKNINKDKFNKLINKKILRYIENLTIDKSLKFDKEYISNYYRQLLKFPKIVQITKCLDKFDNLYNLKNNPDIKIKKKYLKEIKQYIVPLTLKNKTFYKYINTMIKINYKYMKNE